VIPARVGETRKVISQDAYGRGPVTRLMLSLRGRVRHGNSGGPLVDAQGRVAGTVFAASTGTRRRGGFAVPNSVVKRILAGAGERQERSLEGPEHIISWAVGHLVQLAGPDEYDDKYKKWRMADLPIVPSKFKLVVRDERSQKQMSVVKQLMKRDDVDLIINACDAGREGELIFAYLYEKAGAKKPVQRLWLSSMTNDAMREAFANLRDGAELSKLEDAARSRSEADWIVGMNATRAATIRLRSSFDGAVSLGRVQTPTLAILTRREEEIRAFVPEPYWLVDAQFGA